MIINEDELLAQDDKLNNIMAAGAVMASFWEIGLKPEIIMDGEDATNEMMIRFDFLKSSYKMTITVERIPGTEEEDHV